MTFEQIAVSVMVLANILLVFLVRRDAVLSVNAIAAVLQDERKAAQERETAIWDRAMKDKLLFAREAEQMREALTRVRMVRQASTRSEPERSVPSSPIARVEDNRRNNLLLTVP